MPSCPTNTVASCGFESVETAGSRLKTAAARIGRPTVPDLREHDFAELRAAFQALMRGADFG
jgi:hypothetical protein